MSDEQALIDAARAVRDNAWAPYSRFRVGAALRTSSGSMHVGCNVENATYGATVCAERNAVAAAVAAAERSFEEIAIVTDTSPPAMPCGICRQVLAEFGPDLRIISTNLSGEVARTTIGELLPSAFSGADLCDDRPR